MTLEKPNLSYGKIGEICLCTNLRIATRAITKLYDQFLKPCHLRITQFTLLIAIGLNKATNLSDLAELLVMDVTTLTRNLQRLEKQNLIVLRPGRDRRNRTVSLTSEGREKLQQAIPLWKKAQQRITDTIGQKELSNLLTNLSNLVENVSVM